MTRQRPHPPKDFVTYLVGHEQYGANLTDITTTSVGGYPATLVTVTASPDNTLDDGTLGCSTAESIADACFSIVPDYVLRVAVLDINGTTLLIWLRTDTTMNAQDRAADTQSFDELLASVRFGN